MPAPMMAFGELKVRSMLKGETSLPKGDKARDPAVNTYENIMREIRSTTSDYVVAKRSTRFPPTSPVTPAGSQQQTTGF